MPDPASTIEIDIVVEDQRWSAALPQIEDLAQKAVESAYLEAEFTKDAALCLLLTDDTRLAALNRDFRDKDRPTNVLSFPMEGETLPGVPPQLGDIAIAYETVGREAREFDRPLLHHTLHLIVHGSLHLIGYTHEAEQEAGRMEALEIAALSRLGIPSPYEIPGGVQA